MSQFGWPLVKLALPEAAGFVFCFVLLLGMYL